MLRAHQHSNRDLGGSRPLVCLREFSDERTWLGNDGTQPWERGRDGLGKPGPPDRQREQARNGHQSPARTKQRTGFLRHGRVAQRLHELPIHRRRRATGKGFRRLERSSPDQSGYDLSENAQGSGRGQGSQHVLDRVRHCPYGPEQRIREGSLGQAGTTHCPRHLHDRVRKAGSRYSACRHFPRVKRNLHERRAPHPKDSQGIGSSRSSKGRLADRSRACRGLGTSDRFLPQRFRHLGRTRRTHPELHGRQLRAPGSA